MNKNSRINDDFEKVHKEYNVLVSIPRDYFLIEFPDTFDESDIDFLIDINESLKCLYDKYEPILIFAKELYQKIYDAQIDGHDVNSKRWIEEAWEDYNFITYPIKIDYQDLKRKADNIGKVRNGLKRVKYLFQK